MDKQFVIVFLCLIIGTLGKPSPDNAAGRSASPLLPPTVSETILKDDSVPSDSTPQSASSNDRISTPLSVMSTSTQNSDPSDLSVETSVISGAPSVDTLSPALMTNRVSSSLSGLSTSPQNSVPSVDTTINTEPSVPSSVIRDDTTVTTTPATTTTSTATTTTPTIVTTTPAPTTTVPTTITTVIPTTNSTITPIPLPTTNSTDAPSTQTTTPSSATTATASTQTSSTSTPAPTPAPSKDRRFDGPSFIGGIVLSLGIMAIGFVAFKFYKARTRNYHTL